MLMRFCSSWFIYYYLYIEKGSKEIIEENASIIYNTMKCVICINNSTLLINTLGNSLDLLDNCEVIESYTK